MNSTNLKNQIDQQITNKTQVSSITPNNVGNNMKQIVDFVEEKIEEVETTPGPQGVAGPQGPQGVAGPVGPAGLTWRGEWNPLTSYVEDDAVGYDGASWFCISSVVGEPENEPPSLSNSNWALLASQGSPGPQGPQGLPGTSIVKMKKTVASQSDVLNMHTNPINILLNPESNVIKIPISFWIFRKPGNAYFFDVNQLTVITDFNGGVAQFTANPLLNNGPGFLQITPNVNTNAAGFQKANQYRLSCLIGNPTGGTGGLEIYVSYLEFPVELNNE